MQTQQRNTNETIKDEFIVKVKLLSNQVYDFVIQPQTTKVSDLKKMILEKINIPLERQRIVFGGKQLIDESKVTQYVKQSGMTVHLIAKTAQQQSQTTNTPNTANNTSNTSNINNPQNNNTSNSNTFTNNNPQNTNNSNTNTTNPPFPNIMSMLGGLGGLGGMAMTSPQTTTMTFSNVADLSQQLGGLLGSLGIGNLGMRLPTGQTATLNQNRPQQQPNQPNTNTNQHNHHNHTHTHHNHNHTHTHNNPFQTPPTVRPQNQHQTNQPTSSFNTNVNVPPPPQQNSQNSQNQGIFNVSNNPILRLNQTITNLNLPAEPVLDNSHMSLRQQTAQYLRRLQHQYMRMIPQLNRSIQLLNQGRVSHMGEVLTLFQSIGQANDHAQQAIRRLINLPANSQNNQSQNNQQNIPNQPLLNLQNSNLPNNQNYFSNLSNISNLNNTNQQNNHENQQARGSITIVSTTIASQQPQTQNRQGLQVQNQGNTSNQQLPQETTIVQMQMMDQQGNMYNQQDLLNNQNIDANVQATIIIQQNDILDADIDDQPTNFNNNQPSNGPRIINSGTTSFNLSGANLSSLLGSLTGQSTGQSNGQSNGQNLGGGLNLGSLFSMLGGGSGNLGGMGNLGGLGNLGGGINMNVRQGSSNMNSNSSTNNSNNQPQNTNTQPQNNQQSTSSNQQPPTNAFNTQQPMPFNIGNLASMASMLFQPQQQPANQSSNQSQPTQQQQQSNPLGGMMGIFNTLQQSGSMGELMNMSIGDMIEQGIGQPSVYSNIFRSFVGSDLINCFTTKNFDFLDRKYDQIRDDFLQAIALAGCQQDVVDIFTYDLALLFVPSELTQIRQQFLVQVRKIIRKYVSQIASITMNKGDSKYSQKVIQSFKQGFCLAVQFVSSKIDQSQLQNGQTSQQYVFNSIKANAIRYMNRFIQGLAGMFYSFIERDLIRVYNQFKEEKKRKNQRSQEQIATEQQLLKQIETESKKDIEYLTNFKHSQYYHPK